MATTPTKPILQEQPSEGEPELAPAPDDADGMWMAEGQVLMESGGGPDSRCVLHPVCVRPRHYDSECFMYINEKTWPAPGLASSSSQALTHGVSIMSDQRVCS